MDWTPINGIRRVSARGAVHLSVKIDAIGMLSLYRLDTCAAQLTPARSHNVFRHEATCCLFSPAALVAVDDVSPRY
jgi:hypothetical protein